MMDIRQLEVFVAVADDESFSAAAMKLLVSQPTISSHISTLEKELGGRLFHRLYNKTVLTEIGEKLYPYAVQIISLRNQAEMECKSPTQLADQTIRILASTMPYQYILPVLISEFRLKYPDIQVHTACQDSGEVVSALLSKTVDIGITGAKIEHKNLTYHSFMEDRLVIVTPDTPRFQNLKSEQSIVEYLTNTPFIIRDPDSGTQKQILKYLKNHGCGLADLKVVATEHSLEAVMKSVKNGNGISIVSQLAAEDHQRFGGIRYVVPDGGINRTIYLVERTDQSTSTLAKTFIQFASRK